MFKLISFVLSFSAILNAKNCPPSITTASGSIAPGEICSGSLIFEENFDTLNRNVWQPEVTFGGGGVSEPKQSSISSFFGRKISFLFFEIIIERGISMVR